MNKSEQINELATALCKFQASVGTVAKKKTVKSGAFSYNYADLAEVLKTIRKPLSDVGLSINHSFSESELVTTLWHSSGQWMSSSLPLNSSGQKPQTLGSEITYLRRYALTALLGISSDDDDDAVIAENSEKEVKPSTAAKTITKEQAFQLSKIFNDCDANYKNNFWKVMKDEKKIDKFEQITLDMYEEIKSTFIKRKEKYLELKQSSKEESYA